MRTIFFDLETTSLHFCGQILNCCFTEVDEEWNEVDKLKLQVKLNPTELPNPYAICSNRVDVLEHNKNPEAITELEAMHKIYKFLTERVDYEKTVLIGKNSYKFDIPFLRTSMIRNGLTMYLGKNLVCKDIQHLIEKLLITNKDFRNKVSFKDPSQRGVKRLEHVCKSLGILTGSQDHESESDVILTIKLAEYINSVYGIDIRTFNQYEGKLFEVHAKIGTAKNYSSSLNQITESKYYCHDANKNYVLFLDIDKYNNFKNGVKQEYVNDIKDCFKWVNKNDGYLFFDNSYEDISGTEDFLSDNQVLDVNLENFFPPVTCDIESFIYRLSYKASDVLRIFCTTRKMPNNFEQSEFSSDRDLIDLCKRFVINNFKDSGRRTEMVQEYANYRYGTSPNAMKVDKFDRFSTERNEDNKSSYHETIFNYMSAIEQLKQNSDNQKILDSLVNFYYNSEIYNAIKEIDYEPKVSNQK